MIKARDSNDINNMCTTKLPLRKEIRNISTTLVYHCVHECVCVCLVCGKSRDCFFLIYIFCFPPHLTPTFPGSQCILSL